MDRALPAAACISGENDALPDLERSVAMVGNELVDDLTYITGRFEGAGNRPKRVTRLHDVDPRRDWPTGERHLGGGEGVAAPEAAHERKGAADGKKRDNKTNDRSEPPQAIARP